MSLSFVNDFGFIASSSLVKKIIKTLESITKAVLDWERLNAITYNISKIETVLFSKLHL